MQHVNHRNLVKTTTFTLATEDDVAELAAVVQRFYEESAYKTYAEFDLTKAEDYGYAMIERGIVPHIIARIDNQIVGFISYSLDQSGWVKPIAILEMFYVVPERRKTALGRVLLMLAMDMATGDGACAFHAPVASGTDNVETLKNLFSKHGFETCGYMMRMSL
jgi:L-amino acid N-acyltransferase YncA